MKRSLLITLVLLTTLAVNTRVGAGQQPTSSNPPQSAPARTAHDDKIFSQVFKLGLGEDVTVKLTSGKERHGQISSIETDGFKIVEVDLGQVILIPYRETKKVYEGYSEKNVLGQRVNPKTRKVAGIVALGGLLGFLAIMVSQIK